jgi:hypothetical protein
MRYMRHYNGIFCRQTLLENPDLPWHYSSLSARLDLHPEFVNSLSDKPWPSYVKRWALSPGALSIEPIQADLVYEPGIAEWMSKFCVDIDFVRTYRCGLELQRVVEIEH